MGAVIAGGGAVGVLAPSVLLDFGRSLLNPTALYVVAALRVVFGALLLWLARLSRMPRTVRVIGIIIVIAGLLTPVFGVERSAAVFTWWSNQDPLLVRIPAAVAVMFGAFIVYVLSHGRRIAA
jgi:uncharacterized membrane protein